MKQILAGFVLLCACFSSMESQDRAEWTWSYAKQFTASDHHWLTSSQAHLFFVKTQVPNFSQLIFSWNALRPRVGYFSFLVQVRNSKTQAWGAWHKMADWGALIQRSYSTNSDGFAQYFHVRLEIDPKQQADAFAIKIESHGGAPLDFIHRCAINISDIAQFFPETHSNNKLLSSVHIDNVPRISQMALEHPRAAELCSPTSSSILVSYLCGRAVNPIDFASQVFDVGLNTYGSWPFNTAHSYEQGRGNFYFSVVRCDSFAHLHNYLTREIPVVVSVRGPLEGAPKPYLKGHLLVVVGYDSKKREVICHDPACIDHNRTQIRYALHNFLRAWERSRRLAYVAEYSNNA